MKRTHHCNELRPAHIGQTVTLSGWVHSRRDLGGLIFIDIRDREGRTQTVFDPSDLAKEVFHRAASLRSECVVTISGTVRPRPAGTNNPKIPTGEVEVAATVLEALNMADVEKYFQIARCYRDEALRADRQPEFTQIDIEMSFIEREDIYTLVEGLLRRVWKVALGMDIVTPFTRISYTEALNRYGMDKPD